MEDSILGVSMESDDDDSGDSQACFDKTFSEFKELIRISNKLTLEVMNEIRDPSREDIPPVELFWEKITSMDPRITSSDLTQNNNVSIRDLVYAIFHYADNFLRRDMMQKMSSCQLAIPIFLPGVDGIREIFLHWSLRGVCKKLPGPNHMKMNPIDRPIYNYPMMIVGVVRMGNVRLSKSDFLNYLFSEYQGSPKQSFFLWKGNDLSKPMFSKGTVEAIWYVPHKKKEQLNYPVTILNLRGDCNAYPNQLEFIGGASNLTIVFISNDNWNAYKAQVGRLSNIIKDKHNEVLFVCIRQEDKPGRSYEAKSKQVLKVNRVENKEMSNVILSHMTEIMKFQSRKSLEITESGPLKESIHSGTLLDVSLDSIVRYNTQANEVSADNAGGKFKVKVTKLHAEWWSELSKLDDDQRNLLKDETKNVEQKLCSIEDRKRLLRQNALKVVHPKEVTHFRECLQHVMKNNDIFDYIYFHLKERLFESSDDSISQYFKDEHPYKSHAYSDEIKKEGQMNIGIEDFIRELSLLYEVRLCNNPSQVGSEILRLPKLVAKFLLKGHPLEIMDDRTYQIPFKWVQGLFDELKLLTGDSNILVVSIIGAQGSGKSTLLNSMFGTQFVVSAGRCTKGLYIRLLKIEDNFCSGMNCEYILLIDTEGLKSDHGGVQNAARNTRIDNHMVTLAMCVSDCTFINIDGENIDTEMLGCLQIAAYALIRMKKVNLASHCRILQQRVSDITATAKNQLQLSKVKSELDEAVKLAAEAEGVADMYTSFSDLFQLQVVPNFQYIPTLWSSTMDPPNYLYSETISEIKRQVLQSVVTRQIKPQFDFSGFCQRLIDVCTALSEENFALNFVNTARAIEYGNISLNCNKLLAIFRHEIVQRWSWWHFEIKRCDYKNVDEVCQRCYKTLEQVIDDNHENVKEKFRNFMKESIPDTDVTTMYVNFFEDYINANVQKIKGDIQNNIRNSKRASRWASIDVNIFAADEADKIRQKVIEEAKEMSRNAENDRGRDQLQKTFEERWPGWVKCSLAEYNARRLLKPDIAGICESTLTAICSNDPVLSHELTKAITERGGIFEHITDPEIERYLRPGLPKSSKTSTKYGGKTDTVDILKQLVVQVTERTIELYKSQSRNKPLNTLLIHSHLEKALVRLSPDSMRQSNNRIPKQLLARTLLHICRCIYKISAEHQEEYDRQHSPEAAVDDYKEDVLKDYLAFSENQYQDCRALEVFKTQFAKSFQKYVLAELRMRIINHFRDDIKSKQHLHLKVLNHLFRVHDPIQYVSFIQDESEYTRAWLHDEMTSLLIDDPTRSQEELATESNTRHLVLTFFEEALSECSQRVSTALTKNIQRRLGGMPSIDEWKTSFCKLLESDKVRMTVDIKKMSLYNIEDITNFSDMAISYIVDELDQVMRDVILVPGVEQSSNCASFLDNELGSPSDEVFKVFQGCQSKCPFCGAFCAKQESNQHKHHESFCHYPRGVAGRVWKENGRLVEESCSTSICSDKTTYEHGGRHHAYKEYAGNFPEWRIPTLPNPEETYWKWVLFFFNNYFAQYHQCIPADVPDQWSSLAYYEEIVHFLGADPKPRVLLSMFRSPSTSGVMADHAAIENDYEACHKQWKNVCDAY